MSSQLSIHNANKIIKIRIPKVIKSGFIHTTKHNSHSHGSYFIHVSFDQKIPFPRCTSSPCTFTGMPTLSGIISRGEITHNNTTIYRTEKMLLESIEISPSYEYKKP